MPGLNNDKGMEAGRYGNAYKQSCCHTFTKDNKSCTLSRMNVFHIQGVRKRLYSKNRIIISFSVAECHKIRSIGGPGSVKRR